MSGSLSFLLQHHENSGCRLFMRGMEGCRNIFYFPEYFTNFRTWRNRSQK